MSEAERYAADLRKTVRLPRPDRALVSAYDEIELHGAEASFPRADQRMLKHQAGDARPPGPEAMSRTRNLKRDRRLQPDLPANSTFQECSRCPLQQRSRGFAHTNMQWRRLRRCPGRWCRFRRRGRLAPGSTRCPIHQP